MTNNRINYSIGFNVDQTGLNQIKTSLQQIQSMTANDFMKINNLSSLTEANTKLNEIKTTSKTVEIALEKAFNPNLKSVNVVKFNQLLKESGTTIKQVQTAYSQLGATGATAFRNLTTSLVTANTQMKQTHGFLQQMGNTMKNTIKWGVASSVMNSFSNSVRSAYGYVKHLDTSLNDIRIVTGKSADEMARFAKTANDAAKKLGQSTTAYTEASLIYYQQGLGDTETQARAETTLKAANVTGQTGAEVSEQLTAVWNGYKVSAEETELYVDKLAAVAASTASDLEELSTGMSKVASAASTAGVDIDQLNATLSTVISVTRQAPESVGTAFKTIYARLGDLAVDGQDEFGTSLGQVSSKLKTMGIEILDSQGQMRDMGTVVEEVAAKWDTWSSAQKQAAAVAMAGKRQYNNLIALFENWDMYERSLLTSANAAGTLQNQQDIYMESTAAHLKTLKASMEDIWDSLIDTGGLNALISGITKITDGVGLFTDAIGGSTGALALLGTVGLGAFKKDIASGIATSITNMELMQEAAGAVVTKLEILKSLGANIGQINSKQQQEVIQGLGYVNQKNQPFMSQEERTQSNERIGKINQGFNQLNDLQQQENPAKRFAGIASSKGFGDDITSNMSTLQKLEQVYKNVETQVGRTGDKFTETATNLKGNNTALAENAANLNRAKDNFANYSAELNKLAKTEAVSKESKIELARAEKDMTAVLQTAGKEKITAAELSKKMMSYEEAANKVRKEATAAIKTQIGAEKQRASAAAATKAELESLMKTELAAQRSASMKGVVQGYVGAAQAVSMLTVGVSSLYSAFKVLGNESLSTGEKLLQFATSITAGIASFAMGGLMLASNIALVKTSRDSYTELTMALDRLATTMGHVKGATQTEHGARVKNTGAIKKETIELDKNTAAKKRNAMAGGGKNFNVKRGPVLGSNPPSKKSDGVFLDAFNKKLTANTGKAGQALTNLGNKVSSLIPAFANVGAKAVIGLGAIGVAAGAAALAIWGISRAVDAHNIKAEKMAKKAQEANNEYTQLKSRMDTFNQQVSAYEDATTALDGLIKGTKEYNEQLLVANDAALELLNKHEGLKSTFKDGVISIDQESLEKVQHEQAQHLAAQQAEALKAQQEANKAQYNADVVNTYRDLKYDEDADTSVGGASRAEFDDAIDNIAKALADGTTTYEQAINEANLDNPELVEALKNNETKITTLIDKNQELINSNTLLREVIARAFLDENPEFQGLDPHEQDYMTGEMGREEASSEEFQRFKKDSEWAGDEYVNGKGGRRKIKDAEHSKEEAYEEYAARNNLKYDGTNLVGKAKFINEETGEVVQKKSETEVRDSLTTEDARVKYYSQDSQTYQTNENEMQRIEAGVINNTTTDEAGGLLERYMLEGFNSGTFALDFGSSGALTETDIQNQISSVEKMYKNNPEKLTEMAEGTELASMSAKEIRDAIVEGLQSGLDPKAIEQRNQTAQEESDSDLEGFAEQEGFDAEALKTQRDLLMETNDACKDNIELATEMAKKQQQQQRGLDKLTDGWEDYKDVIEDSNSTDAEKAEAISEVEDGLKDLLGMSQEEWDALGLPPTFVRDNMDLIEDFINGAEGSTEALFQAMSESAVIEMNLDPTSQAAVETQLDNFYNNVDLDNLEIGTSLNTTGATAGFQELLNSGAVTADQLSAILGTAGFNPVIEWVDVEVKSQDKKKGTSTVEYIDPNTGELATATVDSTLLNDTGSGMQIPIINGEKTTFSAPKAPPASNRTGGNGGGGGGGGGKAKKSYKSSTKQRDPFRKVNNRISKLGHQMDKLADAQDRLMGPRLTKNLNAQLDILKKQKQAAKDKLDIALNEARLLRETRLKNERKGYYNDLGDFGIKFNSKTGEMTNFDTKMKYWDDEVRRLNNKWNKLTAKQQEGKKGEALEKEIEKAEANRDKLKELGEQYDEYIYETIPELRTQIQEYAYQEIELKLKLLKVDAELQLDITEALNNLADFKKELIDLSDYATLGVGNELSSRVAKNLQSALATETSLFGLSRDMSDISKDTYGTVIRDKDGNVIRTKNYLTDKSSIITEETDNIDTLTTELEKYYKNPANYNGEYAALGEDGKWYFDEVAFREAIEESRDNLVEAYEDIKEKQQEIKEAYLDTIDAYAESYESQIEILEQHGRQLEHNLELAKLVNGEERYSDYQANLNDAVNKAGAIANIRRAEVEKYKTKMENAKENSEEREKWKQLYLESLEAYNEANIDHVNKMKEAYENTVLAHADAIFGSDRELENQDKLWEIETAKNEEYLDNIDKAYEIQKLNRKLQKDMEKGSLATQQKLKKFRDEEIKKLKEKDKLTQYDVDRANQLYEIELKKLALQESQMNKSKMRLRRDSSGNYSYQFVADEESAENARQELEDAQYNLRQLDEEETKRLSETQKQLLRDFKEYYTQYHSLTRTEQQEQAATYNKFYNHYMDKLQETGLKAQEVLNNFNDSSFDLSQTLFKQDESLFSGLTDAQKAALADSSKNFADLAADTQKAFQNSLLPSWTSTVDAMIAKFGGDGWDSFKTSVETNTQRITEAMTALYNGIEGSKNQSDAIAATTNEFLADELEARQSITTEIETQLGVLEKMNERLAIQANLYGDIADAAEEAIQTANELLADNSLTDGKGVFGTEGGDGTDGSTSENLPDNKTSTQGNKILNEGDKVKVESATFYDKPEKGRKEIDSEYGKYSYLYITNYPKKGISKRVNGVTYVHLGTQDTYSKATSVGWIKKKNIKGYDTGGYTGGGWSDEYKKQGKLAFLHEKELVLNAHDTDNMFKMLNIIRQLQTGKLGSNEQPMQELHNDFMKYSDLTYEQLNLIIQLLQAKLDTQQSLTLEDITSVIDSIPNVNKHNIDNAVFEQYAASMQSILEQYKTLHLSRIVNGSNNTDIILDKMNTILDMQNKELLDQAGQSTSVVINAEFPEARSAEQILQAFDNLEMITSQRLGYEKSRKYK